ncbi:MAG: hypothetical protein RLZZ20_871, partial [Pseudomonadota bacterium]
RLPFQIKRVVTDGIAVVVYLPLARCAALLERRGHRIDAFPLSYYRAASFYTMRTDALDRFGTRLERRFTRSEVERMLSHAGLVDVRFRESDPYWCAIGTKPPIAQGEV